MQTFPHVSEMNPLLLYFGGKACSHGPPLIFGPAPLGDHTTHKAMAITLGEGPGDHDQAIPRAFPYNYGAFTLDVKSMLNESLYGTQC
jgi:hypothetical protein